MSTDSRPPTLSEKTRVPIAWMVTGIVVAASAATVVNTKLNAITRAQENQAHATEQITHAIAVMQKRAEDSWTALHQDRWIDKARLRNPALDLPGVHEIQHIPR